MIREYETCEFYICTCMCNIVTILLKIYLILSFHIQICDSVRVKHPSNLNRIHPVQGEMGRQI